MDGIHSDSGPAMDAWETLKEESPDHFFLYHYPDADVAAGIGVYSVSRDFILDLDFHRAN
jgi:hypothetical protein